jgi:transposase-like protein
MGRRVQRKLRHQHGTSRELFTTYLDEFVWRSHVSDRSRVFI